MNARFDKALDTIKKKEEKWFMAAEGSKTLSTFLLTLLPCIMPKMREEWTNPRVAMDLDCMMELH